MFSSLPVRRFEKQKETEIPLGKWPLTIPAVHQFVTEGFVPGSATVLVGENGTGKSTLVEAIAGSFGLNLEGGSPGARHHTYASESDLHNYLRCVRNPGASKWGFFLRAETMHSLFTYLAGNNYSMRDPDFHLMSHGESFRELIATSRFEGPGFYVLDEPESALSFSAQLGLLAHLIALIEDGRSQVVLSTHSPVLASLPGAQVLELGPWGYRTSSWEDLELTDQYRRFLQTPERYLRHLR
ncbi:AAA family ATPase [Dermatophilus congolensis]|uniref:AAA family ATPase n=1 Tax=Dermatophilus congolensis TaxID=1863 RepID=UPI001AAE209D|nr:AAA family ATPase [Dermatophilus congolensis]MBO3129185.1 AAA family ATPase [Dermatophilus congolensis]MBO3132181.1 AAA family ATPase [Dermatophilus congolensis]MBO3133663.1 AAA family ATPase [Dermatophilus congolensis]MBO3135896.1 AAA family ATPase [Dermatophilus congolensis]MBO3138135.1 AAA family ATPase [Dermatophilus congolensis]